MNEAETCASCSRTVPRGESCPECETVELRSDLEIPGYSNLTPLGRGGMGVVYLGDDPALDRKVAIKVMAENLSRHPESRARFVREARVMATVDHPGVVRVYAFGEIEGQSYLVMEYVEGESLADRILRDGALSPDDALRIVGETAEALQAAWSAGIIHRDIKPANILLDRNHRVRVADFGLSRSVTSADDPQLTATGSTLGTPAYISPEQAKAERKIDFRADIYSLGIVLFELLTGHRPFQGSSPFAVVDQHLHHDVPDPRDRRPELAEQVAHLVRRMTKKDPDHRPASYEELRRAIDEARALPGPSPPARGWPIGTLIAGVAAVAVIAFVLVMTWNRPVGELPKPIEIQTAAPTDTRLMVEIAGTWRERQSSERLEAALHAIDTDATITSDDDSVRLESNGSTMVLSTELAGSIISLRSSVFFDEHNRFTSDEASLRSMSIRLDHANGMQALSTVARTGGWPVIILNDKAEQADDLIDETQLDEGLRLTLDLDDVPWDVVAQHLVEALGQRAIRIGDVWLIIESSQTNDVQERLGLKSAIRRPPTVSIESMASALEIARSDQGLVIVSERLQAILIADRMAAFGDYSRIWSATQGKDTGRSSGLLLPYVGPALDLKLMSAGIRDVFETFEIMTGLDIVVPPDLDVEFQLLVTGVPWDNTVEALTVAVGLTSTLDAGVLHLRWPDQQPNDIVLEIVRLENEDPALFEAFSGLLTSDGLLRVDQSAATVTIRDHQRRARWLRDWIQEIDRMGPEDVLIAD